MKQAGPRGWGEVYSPLGVVNYILKKTLLQALKAISVSDIKVFEPSCGDGRFLTNIYDLLMARYEREGWTQEAAARNILSRQIYGMDVNDEAVKAACDALRSMAGIKPAHIICGDTLDKEASYPGIPLAADTYDIIVGNPPYVTWEIEPDKRAFFRKHYITAQGRINLYRLFLERCIELLKPDGYLGFICPNTYLTDRDSHNLRQLLLGQTHILEIVCLSEANAVFEGITQATTILIVQKKQNISADHQVCVKKPASRQTRRFEVTRMPQRYWQEKTDGKFRLLPAWYEALTDKLNCGQLLGNIAQIYQGEVNLTVHKDDLRDAPEPGNYPLIRGCHVAYYGFLPEQQRGKMSYIRPSGPIRDHANQSRIVLQQVSNTAQPVRLKCGLLTPWQPVYCANSTNYVLLPNQDTVMYYYLMALCHSSVWNLLFSLGSSTNHVTVRELRMLPVPECSVSFRQRLADLVAKACTATMPGHARTLHQVINGKIYQLYGINGVEMKIIEKYREKCGKGLP